METVENIIIVGAGIAGLATALGLHRMGIRSLVLESAEQLRSSGFALSTWSNAWRALDELGVGDKIRNNHVKLQEVIAASTSTGATTTLIKFDVQGKLGMHEVRCVRRNHLVESLADELPHDTIRLNAKVVSIEEVGNLKLLHLADGSTLKTKALVGCDGVNSVVAKWLGLAKPSYTGRYATRGIAEYPDGHGFEPNFFQYFGNGFRCGFIPSEDKYVYWFFTWSPSAQEKELEENPVKLKQFVLSKLGKVPTKTLEAVERSDLSSIVSSHLRLRNPLDLLWGQVYKDNVCLAGDAFHAMTPDIGQGGCAALEDAIVLARCLGSAFAKNSCVGGGEHDRIKEGMEKYVKERRWRCFELITTAYVVGRIQQSDGAIMGFLRDKVFASLLAKKLLSMADFDFGKLPVRR